MTMSSQIPARRFTIPDRVRDHILVTVWLLTTLKQFPYDELVLYPLAMYFTYAFVRDFEMNFVRIFKGAILFVFPIWWFLSALWAVDPDFVIRSGLQLLLTVFICFGIATRLSARDLMISLMLASGVFAVQSFLIFATGSGFAPRGVFSSKNAMGFAMVILWMSSLCLLLDPRTKGAFRIFVLVALALAVFQIGVAQSATAVLLAVGVTCLVFFFGILPRSGLLRQPGFYVFLLILVGLISALFSFVLAEAHLNLIESTLGAFGKDTTLTGRTVLWDYATQQIKREPWLGVGAGGFWTATDWTSEAAKIHAEFYKSKYANFSFHNSYYEIAVHQGLVGLGIVLSTTLWMCARILNAIGRMEYSAVMFFVCVSGLTLSRSMTEAGLMLPFSLMSMLFITVALMTIERPCDKHRAT